MDPTNCCRICKWWLPCKTPIRQGQGICAAMDVIVPDVSYRDSEAVIVQAGSHEHEAMLVTAGDFFCKMWEAK